MKTTLSFGLIVAAAGTLLACSDDEGAVRGNGGTTQTASAGNAGQGSGGTRGRARGRYLGRCVGGGNGGTSSSLITRPGSSITAPDPAIASVEDEAGATGINGGTFFTQSDVMTVDVAEAHRTAGSASAGRPRSCRTRTPTVPTGAPRSGSISSSYRRRGAVGGPGRRGRRCRRSRAGGGSGSGGPMAT